MATVRAVTRMICNHCDKMVVKCSECGEYFTANQKIDCRNDGLKHVCMECV